MGRGPFIRAPFCRCMGENHVYAKVCFEKIGARFTDAVYYTFHELCIY